MVNKGFLAFFKTNLPLAIVGVLNSLASIFSNSLSELFSNIPGAKLLYKGRSTRGLAVRGGGRGGIC